MNNIKALNVMSGFRVMYRGEQYNLIEEGSIAVYNPQSQTMDIHQTFFINKVESGTLETMMTIYEVLATNVSLLMGNDFYTTSEFNFGVMGWGE